MVINSIKQQYPNEWADGHYAFGQNKGSGANPFKSDVRERFKGMAWAQGYDEARMEFVRRLPTNPNAYQRKQGRE